MTPQLPAAAVLEHLPAGVVVLDAEGRLASGNPAAERLLGEIKSDGAARCCDVLGCRRPGTALEARCIAETVRARGDVVGELLVHAPGGDAWLTGAPLGEAGGVVLHLRPGNDAGTGPTTGCASARSGRCGSRSAVPCSTATGCRTAPARSSST